MSRFLRTSAGRVLVPLAALGLLGGCGGQPHSGYTTADSRKLPRMEPGLTLRVLPRVEVRDCEGPYCEVRALISGHPRDGSSPFSAVERSFLSQGWKKGIDNAAGFVLMCKRGYSVSFARPDDYTRTGPADVSKMAEVGTAIAVLEMLPRSCR